MDLVKFVYWDETDPKNPQLLLECYAKDTQSADRIYEKAMGNKWESGRPELKCVAHPPPTKD